LIQGREEEIVDQSIFEKRIGRRTFLKYASLASLVAAGIPSTRGYGANEVVIGAVHPVTGPVAELGIACRRAAQLAVEEANAAGGIKSMGGAKIRLLLGDSESKADVGRSEAERMIKEGAVMLVGPFQSDTAMAVATLAEQRGVPFVIDMGTANDITQKGYKNTFRVCPTSTVFGKKTCEYLQQILNEKKVSVKRAVVTNTGDLFGKVQSDMFIKAHKDMNLPFEIVDHITYPLGVQDLSSEVAKIKAAKPDLLLPVTRSGDSRLLIRELYKQRVPLTGIISPGSPGWYEPEVIKDLGVLVDYVLDNVPWVNPRSARFKEANRKFGEKYPGKYLETNSGYAYTAVLVALDAFNRAASADPNKLIAALRKTNLKDQPMVGGPVMFNEEGDNIGAATAIIQILSGKPQVVLPVAAAEAKYVFPMPKQIWERGV
jgi:branched-chain amino acid transport system substrate-binding protein